MAAQVYEFHVNMSCQVCREAVKNVLYKEAITNVQIDLPTKKVFVKSELSSDDILQILKKTGRACQFLGVKD